MSSDDFHTSISARQSSEGTLSEHTTSDGVHTAMTSVQGTDEEMVEDMDEDSGEELSEDDDADLQSVHISHLYPQVSGAHRTEMPYLAAESFIANSDV
jgi:hypothetical protein